MSECMSPQEQLLTPPLIIQQLLRKLAVPVRTRVEEPGQPAAQRIQAVLLEDSAGAVLVLYPRNQLLDLKRLSEVCGRPLNIIKPDRLRRMLTRHGLSSLPALPAITSSPCLYDERLLEQPVLLIESGVPNLLLDISREDFQLLLGKAKPALFGQPLSSIRLNLTRPADDSVEIDQAMQNFTVRRIQQRLGETMEIPPLAQTAQRIIKLRADPEANIDDITSVVETDPALAAQVIRWAASPLYAAPGQKVRSVEDAIIRVLGFDLVINLALSLALGRHLNQLSDPKQQRTPYWQQAIYTAALIEGLTRLMPLAQRPETGLAYLSGLLHNFGYLLLAHIFPPHFTMICQHQEANPHLAHGHIEQHLLGITREQIGSWMMRDWAMPDEIVTALRFQHDPEYAGPHCAYPNLVYLAINLLRGRGIGSSPQQPIPDGLLQRLGLEHSQTEHALDKVLKAEAALRELANNISQVR
jgi:HD-like signal output (HDOD) protein/prolyl-tRNA editing enzyme YbaK/EbsC (Cys-tRNA(Pro) deacylase)